MTYWIVKDGLAKTFDRATRFQAVSLYHFVPWAVVELGGANEVALRLPSALAMLLATFLLYRLGAYLFDREAGLLAAIVMAVNPSVAFAASDARPYALALLSVVAAMLFLVRWLQTGRTLNGVAYALIAAATVYLHLIFATMLLVHAILMLQRQCAPNRLGVGAVCIVTSLLGLMIVPLGPHFFSLMARRGMLSWAGPPSWTDLIAPAVLVSSALVGLLVALFIERGLVRFSPTAKRAAFLLPVCWIVVPPLSLWLIGELTATRLVVPRYYLPAVPGLALLVGWAIRALEPARSRRIVVTAIVLVSIVCFAHGEKYDDWRAAAEAAQSVVAGTSTPVLVRSGLIESAQVEWLVQPEQASYLLAPTAFYPIGGKAIPLPYDVADEKANRYMEQLAQSTLLETDRFVLVTRMPSYESSFRATLDGLVAPRGLCSRIVGRYGVVSVFVFERSSPD